MRNRHTKLPQYVVELAATGEGTPIAIPLFRHTKLSNKEQPNIDADRAGLELRRASPAAIDSGLARAT